MERPGLRDLLAFARTGDTVVVQEMSRLGRSVTGVLELVSELDERGIGLRVLGLGLDTTTASGRLVLTVLLAVAQMERELLRERVLHGLAHARTQGRIGGRPRALTPDAEALAIRLRREEMSFERIAASLGCSERTIRRVIAKGSRGLP